jgi:hypothetical protein
MCSWLAPSAKLWYAGQHVPGSLPWLLPEQSRAHMLASNSQQLKRQLELNRGELRRLIIHDAPTLTRGREFRVTNLRAQIERHTSEGLPEALGRAYVLGRAVDREAALLRSDSIKLTGLQVDDGSGLALAGDIGDAGSVLWDSDDDASSCSSVGALDEDRMEQRRAQAERRSARADGRHAQVEPLFIQERPGAQQEVQPRGAAAASGSASLNLGGVQASSAGAADAAPAASGLAVGWDSSDDDDDVIVVEQPTIVTDALTPQQALQLPPAHEIAHVGIHHAGAPLCASAFHELLRSERAQPEGWLTDTTINFFDVLIQVCTSSTGAHAPNTVYPS